MTAATAATTPLTDLDRLNHRKVARAGWALYDLADTIWSYAIFSRAISLFLVDKLGDGPGNLVVQFLHLGRQPRAVASQGAGVLPQLPR